MKIKSLLFATFALVMSANVHAGIIDFDPTQACAGPCSDGNAISPGYGDTADVDFVWNTARFWGAGYTGLTNVAYASDGQSNPLIIDLVAQNGALVSLFGFDIGDYLNRNRATQWTVYDLNGGGSLATSGPFNMAGAVVNVVGNWSSLTGLRIELGPDAWDVGIDNINFSTRSPNAVPAPASLAFVTIALLAIGRLKARR